MGGLTSVATRMLKKVGTYQGLPRITNVDTGENLLGYTEINVMATTAFSRTKSHKCWFAGGSNIVNGARIIDKVDNKKYLVMSIKVEYVDNSVVFIDGTLFYVNETCSVSRLSSGLDEFGRVASSTFDTIASDVWVMVNPLVIDVMEQPDRIIDKDKIKMAMQATVDIAVNDRLTTSSGEMFKVIAYTRSELEGINMVHVVPDSR